MWNVTIIGDLEGSWYENGIYHLTLTFPPDFPESLPRPQFKTKMFHPQINEDGYPYLSVSMADSKVSTTLAVVWFRDAIAGAGCAALLLDAGQG